MNALARLFDEYANLDPDPAYWLNLDECTEYCLKCVKEKDAGRGEYSGYGCAIEQEGCLHCAECGKILDYVLTDRGAKEELDHFRSVKFRRNKSLDRDTAYHLARLIEAKESDMDVIRIAARAIRCMRRIPAAAASQDDGK